MTSIEVRIAQLNNVVVNLANAIGKKTGAAPPRPRSDKDLLIILRTKLAQVETLMRAEAADFGGLDDVRRSRMSGLLDDNAWKVSASGNPMWRYLSESGHSWLLPESASGCREPRTFKLNAGLALDKLRNEIAWIEADRPPFRSRECPDGWNWDSHVGDDILF